MYVLKGFINNNTFLDAVPGGTSTIGELSTLSSTYSTTKSEYFNASVAPDLTFVAFTSNDSTTGNVSVPSNLAAQVLQIAAWVYAQTQATPNPGEIAQATILAGLLNQFESSAANFTAGNMVTDGTYWVPEWIQWENTTDSTYGSISTGKTNLVKIWFVDASFGSEYDLFSIVVIPPIATLNNFFTPSANVQALLDAQTFVSTMTAIQSARSSNPETVIIGETYDYVDPTNPANLLPTNWTLLIYGPAGNNIDAISTAIINYILANSSHTQSEWTAILPSLFKQTEFTLIPMWDQYAIPNRNQVTGIYSPIANSSRTLGMMASVAQSYPAAHINSNTCVQTFPYRCVPVVTCGGPNNTGDLFQLEDVFPDLLSVSSQSTDFSKMASTTQTFFLLLTQMLISAESITEYGNVPAGMSTLTRDNIFYLVATLNNVNYLMVTKSNFPLTNVPAFGADGVVSTTSTSGGSGSSSSGDGSSSVSIANTLDPVSLSNAGILSNGDLSFAVSVGGWASARAIVPRSAGLYYVEATVNKMASGVGLGLCAGSENMNGFVGIDAGGIMAYRELVYEVDSGIFTNNAFAASHGTFQIIVGSVIGMAVNLTAGLVWFYNPVTSQWNGDVIANQNPVGNVGGLPLTALIQAGYQGWVYPAVAVMDVNDGITINLGASSFARTAPTGYQPWSTANGGSVSGSSPNTDGQTSG